MKLTFVYFFLLSFLMITACQNEEELDFKEMIQGDWLAEKMDIISFQDTLAVINSPYIYAPFVIKDSTLEIKRGKWWVKDDWKSFQRSYTFQILDAQQDTICLLADYLTKERTFYNYDSDTIKLTRITPQNDLNLTKLSYYAIGGGLYFPSMYLEVQEDSTCIIYATRSLPIHGPYSTKLTGQQFSYLENTIQLLALDTTRREYSGREFSGNFYYFRGLKITSPDTSYRIITEKQGVEIDWLFERLNFFFLQLNLIEDSTIIQNIKDKEFFDEMLLKLPPPPPPNLKSQVEDSISNSDLITAENNEGVATYFKYLKEKWENTPNSLIVKYKGVELGDYLHILFEDEQGNSYDFGDGNNDLRFYDLDHLEQGKKYLNKKFKITWDWKVSIFWCCEGEINQAQARVPSITDIQLIDK